MKGLRVLLGTAVAAMLVGGVAFAQDPLQVGPDVYKLVLENDKVRVLEVTFKPGQKIGMHSHPDHVAYVASAGTLQLTKPDGTTEDLKAEAGQAFWLPAQSHSAVNVGQTEVKVVVVELKAGAAAAHAH